MSPFGNNFGKLCIETEVIYSSVITYTVLRYLQKQPLFCYIICIASSTFKNFNEDECLTDFRFKKADIPRLARGFTNR